MNTTERSFDIRIVLLLYHLLGGVCILAALAICKFFWDAAFQHVFAVLERNGFTFLEVVNTQISISFLVVSLMTMFSQKNYVVYWEDIMFTKLVSPVLTNFNALCSFLFADLIITIALVVTESKYTYMTFLFSILLIMFMSLKMLTVYFSGNIIRVKLTKQFLQEKELRARSKKHLNSYRNHKRTLIQYTIQAIESNDIDIVCENMALLYRGDEDADTNYLVNTMVENNKLYMLSRVAKTCMFIFESRMQMDLFISLCKEFMALDCNKYSGYIESIVKSICECYEIKPDLQRGTLKAVIRGFADTCAEQGAESLAENIKQIYRKKTSEELA